MLTQARSEFAVLSSLTRLSVEYCHCLHYLQMVSEKVAKAMLSRPGDESPPPATHAAFVRMLQVIKSRPDIRRRLGYTEASVFKQYIDSLLPLAELIQRLAPALAGLGQPNPEYPWRDEITGKVVAPCGFEFPGFQPTPQMVKIQDLIRRLLALA